MKKEFIENIKASLITSKLKSFDEKANKEELLTFLRNKKFDIVGIKDSGNKIIGYVNINNLSELKPHEEINILNITPKEIISSEMPLFYVFLKFIKEDLSRLFVINNDEITEIITSADLTKQPVRTLLFNVISCFEEELTLCLKSDPGVDYNSKILHFAETKRLKEKARKQKFFSNLTQCLNFYEDLKEQNRELLFLDCLYLHDKMKFCKQFNLIQLSEEQLGEINKFRNKIVHGNDFISSQNLNFILTYIQNEINV